MLIRGPIERKWLKSDIPIRKSRSIWPIFSERELAVVVDIANVVVATISPVNRSVGGPVNSGDGPSGPGTACLFGFGIQGEPEVLSIC